MTQIDRDRLVVLKKVITKDNLATNQIKGRYPTKNLVNSFSPWTSVNRMSRPW